MTRSLEPQCSLLLAFLLSIIWIEPAEACSPPPQPAVELVSSAFPQDGVIVGRLACGDCEVGDLIFEDSEGNVLEGEFLIVASSAPERAFAWQSSEPLPYNDYDARYSVRVEDPGFEASAFDIDDGDAGVHSTMARLHPTGVGLGKLFACEMYASSTGGLCSLPAYYETSGAVPSIEVSIEGASATQHFHRIAWYAEGEEPREEEALVGLGASHSFDDVPDSVCYAAYATPALGGEEFLVNEECFDVSELELEIVDTAFGPVEETLNSCVVPSEEIRRPWCQYFAEAVQSGSCDGYATEACEAAQAQCEPEDLEEPDSDSEPGDEGEEPETVNEDGSVEGDDESSGGGCSVSVARETSPGWWAFLALAWFVARRRRVTI